MQRSQWIELLHQIASPIINHLHAGTLKQHMPLETKNNRDASSCAHLEAFARLLVGIAPYIETGEDAEFAEKTRIALDHATNPQHPDFMNFNEGAQALVDAAFLANALLRAPNELWKALDSQVQEHILQALRSSRVIQPHFNNWLLFSAMIEAALCAFSGDWDRMRVDYALRQHEAWYVGDGVYGDGPAYHADYYNSFVIQPMLVDIIDVVKAEDRFAGYADAIYARAQRWASIQERSISPEGTYAPIGRSLAYRMGVFQSLAQSALRESLSPDIHPAQVRCALSAVMQRQMSMPNTFDENGWLRIGFAGAQSGIGESYISTGSLYLCSTALLPLGLPADNIFWSAPDESWTSVKAWSGEDFPIDQAMGH